MKVRIEIVQGNGKIEIESDSIPEIRSKLKDIETLIDEVVSISAVKPRDDGMIEVEVVPSNQLETTAVELLRKSKASNMTDKMMVMIYYLWKYKGMDSVNVSDINELLQKSREPLPSNTTALLGYLNGKGLLTGSAKKDNLKAWRITNTGVEYVENEILKKDKK